MIYRLCCLLALLWTLTLTGCVERVIYIDTEPSGATVWLNDQEIGSTPLKTGFLFYGDYDVTIRKENYEPIKTHQRTPRPFYEILGLDFITEVLIPFTITDEHKWQFELQPLNSDKEALLQNALQMSSEHKPVESNEHTQDSF